MKAQWNRICLDTPRGSPCVTSSVGGRGCTAELAGPLCTCFRDRERSHELRHFDLRRCCHCQRDGGLLKHQFVDEPGSQCDLRNRSNLQRNWTPLASRSRRRRRDIVMRSSLRNPVGRWRLGTRCNLHQTRRYKIQKDIETCTCRCCRSTRDSGTRTLLLTSSRVETWKSFGTACTACCRTRT